MNHDNRQMRILKELGIGPVWVRREAPTTLTEVAVLAVNVGTGAPHIRSLVASDPAVSGSLPARDARSSALSSRSDLPTQPFDAEIAAMDWRALEAAVSSCTRCQLSRSRIRTVVGSGDRKANWLFVADGPFHDEEMQGEPLVGPTGKLFDEMLRAIDLRRGENIFVTNVVKCRPTTADGTERAASTEEIAACRPYLARQSALLKPVTVVALGKVATSALVASDSTNDMDELRGAVYRYDNLPVVVTYHPANLIRKPLDKAKVWRDLCLAADSYRSAGELGI